MKKIKFVDIKQRSLCRICRALLEVFLDLGRTPLADKFPRNKNSEEKYYPLQVAICKRCYLVQLMHDVPDEELFSNDYAFYSSGSPSSVAYFKEYADEIYVRFGEEAKKSTLEIASNDGILLKYLQQKGCNVLGIDPAENVALQANADGIPTIISFFNKASAQAILKNEGPQSLILANNVVAHVTDLHDFMEGVRLVMDPSGVFVFEVQYFPHLFFNNQFDHVYHEHRSFFSLHPLVRLLEEHNLYIFDVEEQNTQGGSIRVYASSHKGQTSVRVESMLMAERCIGLHDMTMYRTFQYRTDYIKIKLREILDSLKNKGKVIAGYGASAKGNTLLNFCNITSRDLNFIADKTPYKYGKYTPGSNIIVADQDAVEPPDYYLLLVWNYAAGILQREKKFREAGGKFIMPLPVPHIV